MAWSNGVLHFLMTINICFKLEESFLRKQLHLSPSWYLQCHLDITRFLFQISEQVEDCCNSLHYHAVNWPNVALHDCAIQPRAHCLKLLDDEQ
ncbi:hypothetical protein QE152_g1798 [Popillia japonica]|uniref:Uncharacterized protein n=1 Tax=Popillia japonica TaxID=7064 RepID=A0AAW1N4W8_POPJA